MITRELIFNSTKFYPFADSDTSVTANGKKYYAVPTKVTVPKGTPRYDTGESGFQQTHIVSQDCTVTVADLITKGHTIPARSNNDRNFYADLDVYETMDQIPIENGGNIGWGYFKITDVTNPVWGGKHLLSHLYRAFRAIIARMAVIAWQ